jgi:hypothetical protein
MTEAKLNRYRPVWQWFGGKFAHRVLIQASQPRLHSGTEGTEAAHRRMGSRPNDSHRYTSESTGPAAAFSYRSQLSEALSHSSVTRLFRSIRRKGRPNCCQPGEIDQNAVHREKLRSSSKSQAAVTSPVCPVKPQPLAPCLLLLCSPMAARHRGQMIEISTEIPPSAIPAKVSVVRLKQRNMMGTGAPNTDVASCVVREGSRRAQARRVSTVQLMQGQRVSGSQGPKGEECRPPWKAKQVVHGHTASNNMLPSHRATDHRNQIWAGTPMRPSQNGPWGGFMRGTGEDMGFKAGLAASGKKAA